MEFKGTSGNWYIDQEESHRMRNSVWCNVISTKKTIGLADVYGDDEEAKANAQLIASAPELLEALKELLNEDRVKIAMKESGENSIFNDKVKQAKQAIEKATKID